MSSHKSKGNKDDDVRVFVRKPTWNEAIVAVGVFALLLSVPLIFITKESLPLDMLPCFMAAMLLPGTVLVGMEVIKWHVAPPKKLTTSPQGIEMKLESTSCFVPWENMLHFKWRIYGKFRGWGILIETTPTQDADSAPLRRVTDFVPLTQFVRLPGNASEDEPVNLEHFKKTQLGQELFNYAPHLFEMAESEQSGYEETASGDKSKCKVVYSENSVYSGSWLRKLGIHALVISILAVAFYVVAGVPITSIEISPLIVLLAVTIEGVILLMPPPALVVSPDGIKMTINRGTCFVPWEKMIRLTWQNYGAITGWGIAIEPVLFDTTNGLLSNVADFVPLNRFVKLPGRVSEGEPVNLEHFKKTPLGQELFYYAPHLFDAPKYKNERIEEIIQHGAAALQHNSASTSGGTQ